MEEAEAESKHGLAICLLILHGHESMKQTLNSFLRR